MRLDEARIFRIYVNASDRFEGKPLYQAVVELALSRGLAGAAVFRVESSFGSENVVHDVASEYRFADVPVSIEVVDATEKVEGFAEELRKVVRDGLATITAARILRSPFPGDDPTSAGPGGASPEEINNQTRSDTPMNLEGPAQRVTVYIGSSDKWEGRNLALEIVERCRTLGLAGATTSRGLMGFGKHSLIHRAHFLGLSEDLPERVEIIDRAERIAGLLLPALEELVSGGLVVVEDVEVIHYQHHGGETPAS